MDILQLQTERPDFSGGNYTTPSINLYHHGGQNGVMNQPVSSTTTTTTSTSTTANPMDQLTNYAKQYGNDIAQKVGTDVSSYANQTTDSMKNSLNDLFNQAFSSLTNTAKPTAAPIHTGGNSTRRKINVPLTESPMDGGNCGFQIDDSAATGGAKKHSERKTTEKRPTELNLTEKDWATTDWSGGARKSKHKSVDKHKQTPYDWSSNSEWSDNSGLDGGNCGFVPGDAEGGAKKKNVKLSEVQYDSDEGDSSSDNESDPYKDFDDMDYMTGGKDMLGGKRSNPYIQNVQIIVKVLDQNSKIRDLELKHFQKTKLASIVLKDAKSKLSNPDDHIAMLDEAKKLAQSNIDKYVKAGKDIKVEPPKPKKPKKSKKVTEN